MEDAYNKCLLDRRCLILAILLALGLDSRPMNRCFNSENQNTNSLKIFRPKDPDSAKMDLRKTVSLRGREREVGAHFQVILPNAEAFAQLRAFPGKFDQRVRSPCHSPASLGCFELHFPVCNVEQGGRQVKKTLLPSEPEDGAGPSDFISRRPAGGAPEVRPAPHCAARILNGRGRERPRSVGSRQQLQRLLSFLALLAISFSLPETW